MVSFILCLHLVDVSGSDSVYCRRRSNNQTGIGISLTYLKSPQLCVYPTQCLDFKCHTFYVFYFCVFNCFFRWVVIVRFVAILTGNVIENSKVELGELFGNKQCLKVSTVLVFFKVWKRTLKQWLSTIPLHVFPFYQSFLLQFVILISGVYTLFLPNQAW
jgi:hypothetical protein